VEIVAGLLRHPSPISIDGSEACEYLPYVFKPGWLALDGLQHVQHGAF
jgi:hypothetical protein